MDQLVVAADELAKVDTQFEASVHRTVGNLKNVLGSDADQLQSNLSVSQKSVDVYVRTFQWNALKYRSDKALKETVDGLSAEMAQIDTLLKAKMSNYVALKGSLQAIERKQNGNLLLRNLADVVSKDDFVLDSEFLETVLLVVSKQDKSRFLDLYEKICDMVVPRSAKAIAEEGDLCLFAVVCFSKVAAEFKQKARDLKFQVREFKFDADQIERERKEQKQLALNSKEQWANLLRLLKTNFSELFGAWMHIKGLRLYTESVLRYGLPPTFCFLCVKPKKGASRKKLRDLLLGTLQAIEPAITRLDFDKYARVAVEDDFGGDDVAQVFYPYVDFDIEWAVQ